MEPAARPRGRWLPTAVADAQPDSWRRCAVAISDRRCLRHFVRLRWAVHVTITWYQQGAGMIRPNMATMLVFILRTLACREH
jgi:N-acetylglutamate synthase/N-acetylornithine aminotransferase